MVGETEAVRLVVMKLGAALAVIRYNEGYLALCKVLELLQIKIHPSLI